ncbi:DUF4752 family protein [Xenorhabdus bovienii]|uniref:DUF4752 family protein n=1 Tax=Xenorhabdus bovienii TaxID=40576 RepID=UPI00237CBE40|nr:DUF4752 family protein [Xenorhabdus bovienii]MDE1488381.1 DUF4752 family protein [Xenorhabdus bovienii]MDE9447846.1 DUF4752 family protein [Xenorhabdus bovienii]MDE9479216.1 DUF4752 family protein [Xenorhabdus bovienii]MDE9532048.1 DUF4752 family protein [Xenorhabdus bovienii]
MINIILGYMISGLMVIGYMYILVRAWNWLGSLLVSAYYNRRKEERKQKAVNELYDAFELEQIQDGQTMKVATKGGLVIMMYRQQSESK